MWQAPTQQSIKLHEASQLVDIADFDQFCSVYSEFNVVDLWLYVEEASVLENVAKQGLQVSIPNTLDPLYG